MRITNFADGRNGFLSRQQRVKSKVVVLFVKGIFGDICRASLEGGLVLYRLRARHKGKGAGRFVNSPVKYYPTIQNISLITQDFVKISSKYCHV